MIHRKEGQTETPTLGADAPTGLSVRDVVCEEQQKTWTVVRGSTLQEGQKGLETSPILSRQEWSELQKDQRSWERVVLQGQGGLLLLLLFAGKQSERHGQEFENIWNRKQIYYKGFNGGFIIRGGGRRVLEYRSIVTDQHDGETEIESFFSCL